MKMYFSGGVMNCLKPNDPRISVVFPGIRQNHQGQSYREGKLDTDEVCFIDASDSHTYKFTDGTFMQDTLHVVMNEDGREYRAGSRPTNEVAKQKEPMPHRYYTRDEYGISRAVG